MCVANGVDKFSMCDTTKFLFLLDVSWLGSELMVCDGAGVPAAGMMKMSL